MKTSERLWRALESVPGLATVSAEWKALLGPEYNATRNFFRPNGKQASSYPCFSRNGCGCAHGVITHAPDDIVSVCRCDPKRCDTVPLTKADIAIYEVDLTVFCTAVASALQLTPEETPVPGLHMTFCIGTYFPYNGYSFPVYLTIQIESPDFQRIAEGLVVRSDKPFVLLAPTHDLCSRECEKLLRKNNVCFHSLSNILILNENGKFDIDKPIEDFLAVFCTAMVPTGKDSSGKVLSIKPANADLAGTDYKKIGEIPVEFIKQKDGWHWIINRKDKGLMAKRENSIIYKINRILYDQIGCGWTPHRTFYQATGWTKEEYFGGKDAPGRMQKQLGIIRKKLGLEILFRKGQGVRFSENIVNPK